jgi:HSP20 family protein
MVDEKMNKAKDKWEEALEKETWLAPLTDIYETDSEYFMETQMPGVSKESVRIKLEEGQLVMMGKVDLAAKKDRRYVLKESEIGNYFRKVNLSEGIDEDNIEASFEDGLLKVILPKHSRLRPKTIEIN